MKTIALFASALFLCTQQAKSPYVGPTPDLKRPRRFNHGRQYVLQTATGLLQPIHKTNQGTITFTDCNHHTALFDIFFNKKTFWVGDFASSKKTCNGGDHHDDEIMKTLQLVRTMRKERHVFILVDQYGKDIALMRKNWKYPRPWARYASVAWDNGDIRQMYKLTKAGKRKAPPKGAKRARRA